MKKKLQDILLVALFLSLLGWCVLARGKGFPCSLAYEEPRPGCCQGNDEVSPGFLHTRGGDI